MPRKEPTPPPHRLTIDLVNLFIGIKLPQHAVSSRLARNQIPDAWLEQNIVRALHLRELVLHLIAINATPNPHHDFTSPSAAIDSKVARAAGRPVPAKSPVRQKFPSKYYVPCPRATRLSQG